MTFKPIKYINGRELMERWGIGPTALIQYCDGYIQGYRKEGPENKYRRPYSWKEPEGSVKINADVILVPVALPHELSITGCLFLIDEIETFEQNHPEIVNQQLSKQVSTGIVIDGTAPEYLRIAAEAWGDLYKSGAHRKWKGGHVKNIISWINEKYPDIDPTPATMIAKIINPNKNGGAPRT